VFCGTLGQNFVPSSKIPHWLIFCEGTVTKNIWKPWTAVGLSVQMTQRVSVPPSVNMGSLIEPHRRHPKLLDLSFIGETRDSIVFITGDTRFLSRSID
jgi:hypothetical protein